MEAKYTIKLSEEETKEVIRLLKNGRTLKIRQKAGAVYYRHLNKSVGFMMSALKISNSCAISHIKKFREKGFKYFEENNYKGQTSQLEQYKNVIIKEFTKEPPKTIREATIRIEELTGIKRGYTQVTNFLKKKGFHTKNQKLYQLKQTKKNNKSS